MTNSPSFILGKFPLEKTSLNLTNVFPVNIFPSVPNIEAPKIPNNIPRNPPSCFCYFIFYCFTNSVN